MARGSGPSPSVRRVVLGGLLAAIAAVLLYLQVAPGPEPFARILAPIPVMVATVRLGPRSGGMVAFVAALVMTLLAGPFAAVITMGPPACVGVALGAALRARRGWWAGLLAALAADALAMAVVLVATVLLFGNSFFKGMAASIAQAVQGASALAAGVPALAHWMNALGTAAQSALNLVPVMGLAFLVAHAIFFAGIGFLVSLAVLRRLGMEVPAGPRWLDAIFDWVTRRTRTGQPLGRGRLLAETQASPPPAGM
jgi:uncharacterized protein YybS (DUF2232 family)